MDKIYVVAGANWVAQIDLSDFDPTGSNVYVEACTRAVEAKFGTRKDIPIQYHTPIALTLKQRTSDAMHASLVDLMTDEIEPGCGIGALLCIMDTVDPESFKDGEEHEWFMSSKLILENAGVPKLVEKFNVKYPTKKKDGA